jgi:hypothetical protein
MSGLNFATAYIDLALRGQQGVTAALAQMRQQFQQTTATATTFRNLLNAGPGTRLARQQLERNALLAQVRAAEAGAGARAMATPAGRRALARQAQAESDTTTGVLRQQRAQAQARADFATGAPGRSAAATQAALEAETRLAEARQKNAALAAQAAHAESMTGRADLFAQAQAQRQGDVLAARSGLARAQADAAQAATPAGQQGLQEQYRLQGQTTAAALRRELAEGRAKDAYEQSPEGRAAGAEVRRLRQERDEQEEARRRRQLIDEYGQLGGRMRLFKDGLAKAAPYFGVAATGYAALSAYHRGSVDLAHKANPALAQTAALTQQGLEIQAGKGEQGAALREDAARLRQLEEMRRNPNPGWLEQLRRRFLASGAGQNLTGVLANYGPDSVRPEAERNARDRETLKRGGGAEFMGPFRSRFESFEGFGEALQMAGTNTSTLEGQNLQDQLKTVLETQGSLLERIADNTDPTRQRPPAFR